MRYSKLTLIMLYLFFVPAAIDLVVTIKAMQVSGHDLGEALPLYVLLGNTWYFWLIMSLVLLMWYYLITKTSKVMFRWAVLTIIMWQLLARTIAIAGNIYNIYHPVSYAVASVSTAYQPVAKISFYATFIGLLVYLPLVIQWISLKIFTVSYEIKPKGDEY